MRRGDDERTLHPGGPTHADVVGAILAALTDAERAEVSCVGHRVVHGGRRFAASVTVDDDVVAALQDLIDLAPLHLPANLAGIAAARAQLPELTHVAVFDTSFHQTMPPVAYRYAVPGDWYTKYGFRRYGAHGTSFRYVSERAAELLAIAEPKLVVAHLGNGCSAAAIDGGRSVDTTMGLTPLAGLVMGTRSGDVDPSVFGYLAARTGMGIDEITTALNKNSGLLGLSGLSNDLRTVSEAAAASNAEAILAQEV